jgi:hypothetical protein
MDTYPSATRAADGGDTAVFDRLVDDRESFSRQELAGAAIPASWACHGRGFET